MSMLWLCLGDSILAKISIVVTSQEDKPTNTACGREIGSHTPNDAKEELTQNGVSPYVSCANCKAAVSQVEPESDDDDVQ